MTEKVLIDDWADYEHVKRQQQDQLMQFNYWEGWEVNYLVDKILRLYPIYTEALVRRCIRTCCAKVPEIRERTDFVECVMKRLRGEAL